MTDSSNRNQSLPKVFADQLRERIRSGEWAPGERLPKEADLVAEGSFSRITVRSGLQLLAAAGWIETRHGIGTFVSEHPPSVRTGLEELRSISDVLREQGRQPEWRYRICEKRPATLEQASHLGLARGADVLYLERALFADGEPLAFDYGAVVWSHFPDDLDPETIVSTASVFEYLEPLGLLPAFAECSLSPVLSADVGWEPYRPDSGLYLLLEHAQFLTARKPLDWHLFYVIEDRFSFDIIRRRL